MLNRVFIRVWFTCIALVASIHAADCKSLSLYSSDNPSLGFLRSSTFPENPEWKANWGIMGDMKPPYIRFSGQQNQTKNWKTVVSFPQMPLYASDGFLELKIRTTQKAQIKMALEQEEWNSSSYSFFLEANQTQNLKVPVSSVTSNTSSLIEGISIELIQVPAYQYITLFINDISFSCTSTSSKVNTYLKDEDSLFIFSETVIEKAVRIPLDTEAVTIPYALKNHSDSAQIVLRSKSTSQIVLTENEHLILQNFISQKAATPKQSWNNWNESLYYISKNRLSDSLFANPKAIFRQANDFSASYNYQAIPVLIGFFNYEFIHCEEKRSDSTCIKDELKPSKIMIPGFGSSFIYSSKVDFILDPYFITTNQKSIPEIELFLQKEWVPLKVQSKITHTFDALGVHSIPVRLRYGSEVIETTLLLEVR